MKTYKHLNLEERETFLLLKAQGQSLRKIARFLKRSPSSLSRELKRNKVHSSLGPAYRALKAHWQARIRLKQLHRKSSPLDKNPELQVQIVQLIENRWSPELIAGRLNREAKRHVISHETIYRWIYSNARHLIPCLLRSHPKRWRRRSRSWIKRLKQQRLSIHQRPEEINQRSRAGHWETDLMWSQGRAALQVVVERQTRFTQVIRIPNKTARESYQALSAILSPLPPALRQSLTYDNGVENFLFEQLNELLGTKAYFCDPYSAWQKGTVENTNGLIRRFLPRSTNFDTLPFEDIQRIQDWLNHRPRKCLGFQTPAEAFKSATVALTT